MVKRTSSSDSFTGKNSHTRYNSFDEERDLNEIKPNDIEYTEGIDVVSSSPKINEKISSLIQRIKFSKNTSYDDSELLKENNKKICDLLKFIKKEPLCNEKIHKENIEKENNNLISLTSKLLEILDLLADPPKEDFTELEKKIEKDPFIKEVAKLKEINITELNRFHAMATLADNSPITKLLRLAQKIMSFIIDTAIPYIGYFVFFISFLAIFTDPSASFAILSVVKGFGFGSTILYLGPLIPNLIRKILYKLETLWVTSYFPNFKEDILIGGFKKSKVKKENVIDNLKKWIEHFKNKDTHSHAKHVMHYLSRVNSSQSQMINFLHELHHKIVSYTMADSMQTTPGEKDILNRYMALRA